MKLHALIISFCFITLDYLDVNIFERFKSLANEYFLSAKLCSNQLIEFPSVFSRYVQLKKENDRLTKELDELKIKKIIETEEKKELEDLRNFLKIKTNNIEYKYMEKVIGIDKTPYESYILIASNNEELQNDCIVFSNEGLVGIVHIKYKNHARILPITSSKLSIPVKTDLNKHLILSGQDNDILISKEILDNSTKDLKVGDILKTSGEGGFFGINIPVAEIIEINQEKNIIKAKPVVNFDKLVYVFIQTYIN